MPHTCTKSRTGKTHVQQPNRRAERQRRAAERENARKHLGTRNVREVAEELREPITARRLRPVLWLDEPPLASAKPLPGRFT